MMNTQNFEWHSSDDDPLTQFAEQSDKAAGITVERPFDASSTRERSRTGSIYELILVSILICSLVGFFIWQKTDRRIAVLELELGYLQSKMATAPESAQNAPLIEGTAPTIEGTIQNKEIGSQWRALAEILEMYMHVESGEEPFWHLRTPDTLQRRLAWKPSVDLIFTPGSQSVQNFYPDVLPLDDSGETIQYDVAFLLVEYIHTEYGATRLTVLRNALPQHEGWETLAPALFNLSAGEFEQAWHGYLAAQYRS